MTLTILVCRPQFIVQSSHYLVDVVDQNRVQPVRENQTLLWACIAIRLDVIEALVWLNRFRRAQTMVIFPVGTTVRKNHAGR
jgi:hypothetical protein